MRKVRPTDTQGLVQGHTSFAHVTESGLDPGLKYHTALVFAFKESREQGRKS